MDIITHSGLSFEFENVDPDMICIEDIAHALSMQCRFAGHVDRFYSVAEHCVNMSLLCPEDPLGALLHDAAEAYCVDVPSPLKKIWRGKSKSAVSFYDETEKKILEVILQKYLSRSTYHHSISEMDIYLCHLEAYKLFLEVPDWCTIPDHPFSEFPLHPYLTFGHSPKGAKELFMRRFLELNTSFV